MTQRSLHDSTQQSCTHVFLIAPIIPPTPCTSLFLSLALREDAGKFGKITTVCCGIYMWHLFSVSLHAATRNTEIKQTQHFKRGGSYEIGEII